MSNVVPKPSKGAPAGRFGPSAVLTAVVLTSAALLAAFALPRYPDAPPVGHTGGFGEPTCATCHFDGDLNDPAGKLVLTGVPAAYSPGTTYTLTLTLTRPGLEAGGFQLTARYATGEEAGRAAGELTPVDNGVGVTVDPASGVSYVHHRPAGTVPAAPGTMRWQIEWTAPAGGGPVVFHAAANASDGDQSPFGDWIYTTSEETQPASARASS